MEYKEVEIEFMDFIQKHIIIDNGDGNFKSFPAEPENPEYVLFLKAIEKESS